MKNFQKICIRAAVALLVGTGAVATTTSSASAYVVCNRYGDCWNTRHHYNFPVRLGVRFYSDDWHRHHDWDRDRYRHWRGDRDDRGYWRNGVWINF
jgi:hypothetical protein